MSSKAGRRNDTGTAAEILHNHSRLSSSGTGAASNERGFMSKQRLSKLQKWILENCFRVTVLLDRTNLKKLKNIGDSRKCRDCSKTNESVRLERNLSSIINPTCIKYGFTCPYFEFYKEDILLSFFLLEPNNDTFHLHRVQHFHNSPDYTKVHVTAHRSINNLTEKGLVYAWNAFQEDSLQINLTDEGMKKAAELLNIPDYLSLFKP
jgi:hypothetical protein